MANHRHERVYQQQVFIINKHPTNQPTLKLEKKWIMQNLMKSTQVYLQNEEK